MSLITKLPLLIAPFIAGVMCLTCLIFGLFQASNSARLAFGCSSDWVRLSEATQKIGPSKLLWTDVPGSIRQVMIVKAVSSRDEPIAIVTPKNTKIGNGWLKASNWIRKQLPANSIEERLVYIYSDHPLLELLLQTLGLFGIAGLSYWALVMFIRKNQHPPAPRADGAPAAGVPL